MWIERVMHFWPCWNILIKWRKLGIFFALLREACYKGDGDNIKNSGKSKKVKRERRSKWVEITISHLFDVEIEVKILKLMLALIVQDFSTDTWKKREKWTVDLMFDLFLVSKNNFSLFFFIFTKQLYFKYIFYIFFILFHFNRTTLTFTLFIFYFSFFFLHI